MAMLYLGLILDENLLDKQLVWLWRKSSFDCAHCGFFQSRALGLLCFHPAHLPECVREGNLLFLETAHLPATQEISACSLSLFLLSSSQRGKGRGVFGGLTEVLVLFREEEQQMHSVAQMPLWEEEGLCTPSLYGVCDLTLIAKPHIFKCRKLEAVAVIRIQSPIASGVRI